MKFRMTCPKCDSSTFSIERDNRSYAPRGGQTFEMIFSCRCGKQMFGDQIVQEYEQQKKAWEASQLAARDVPQHSQVPAEPPAEPAPPVPQPTRELAKAEAPKATSSKAQENQSPAAPQAALDPEEAEAAEATEEPHGDSHDHDHDHDHDDQESAGGDEEASDICGWHPCSNVPRPKSKYCSRDCSNKNARWRYKQRKAAEKEAA